MLHTLLYCTPSPLSIDVDGCMLRCKPLLVEKYGEFYGEEKLIWADGWGDGVGRPEGEEKGEEKNYVEVSM